MRRIAANRRLARRCGAILCAWIAVALAECTSSSPQEGSAGTAEQHVKSTPASGTPVASSAVISTPTSEPAELASTSKTEQPADAEHETVKSKQRRTPIYDEAANARADIEAAFKRAEYSHKRVLVKFGANWCGWCYKLHDVFQKHPEVAPLMRSEYELVLVDVNANADLLKECDPNNNQHGYPWLTVLDAVGLVLVNQNTAENHG